MGKEMWESRHSPSFWGDLTAPLLRLLLVLLLLPEPGTCQALCLSQETPQSLTEPRYGFLPSLDLDSGFMSGIVQSFLGLVQPNPFPKDLLVKIIEDNAQITEQETIQEALHYEIGFLVCVAIGILYIVLMPLVGFFFACCRCCGNCGGRMYQEQTRNINCRRRGLYWATLIITLIILAGNICMFASNESTKKSVEETPQRLNITLSNLQTYLTAVPEQITSVVDQGSLTVDNVSNKLNDIGPLLGREIQKGLNGALQPALETVKNLAQEVNSTSRELTHLNSSIKWLQSDLDVLKTNLTAVQDRINNTLQKPGCNGCSGVQSELEQLSVDTTLHTPGLNQLQSAVDKAQEADLNSKAKEGQDFFDTIPQRVTNETKSTVQSVQNELASIKTQISQVTNDIPVDTIESISKEISIVQGYVEQYSPNLEEAEKYRWIVGAALSCLILLVVVCNLLGLFLGPAGLKPKADPTERSCTADCGGSFFMAGVGFSFLFSWIFMLLVLILFLVGGNTYTLICKPWRSQELFEIIDTPGLIPGFNLSASLGLKTHLTITDIYSDCNQNKSLWITLHLDEIINLNELLNVSRYTEDIRQNFEKTDISISSVTLLTPNIISQLESVSKQAGSVNFNSAIDQINTFSTSGENLTAIANKLDQLAAIQAEPIKSELHEEANDLRSISNEFNVTINPQLQVIKSSIERLSVIATQINETIVDVLQKVGAAQAFLNSNTSKIVKDESRDFLDCQLKYFTAFAEWANITITQQIGQCGPVALAVNSAETIVCTHLVESLNAFWFSLGWCMLFLIPSIILSVKLAKFYRRMKETDVFENPIPLTTFPRAAMMKPY